MGPYIYYTATATRASAALIMITLNNSKTLNTFSVDVCRKINISPDRFLIFIQIFLAANLDDEKTLGTQKGEFQQIFKMNSRNLC